ncbi:consortin [Lates japonicus]|uniref:Consortin n=1 Tax=Lates japonicus TaxID=270547 RepID=A0AAD3MQ94_LATJO|nr:consortin [Lates japonicus]
MDHGGQVEREGRVMSQVPVGGVDLCDNLPNPEALTTQTRNLNETNALTLNEEEGGHRLIQKSSFNNNGKDEEEEQGKEGYTGRDREEDEEEDSDEVMKEEEVEEESEESSGLVRCQSPDTPMTDSSYSETVSTCLASGPIPNPALLESLEQLAQEGDDTHLHITFTINLSVFLLEYDMTNAS